MAEWSRRGGICRLGFASVELEAGGVTHLVGLGKASQQVPEWVAAGREILPARPPKIERAGGKIVPSLRPVGCLDQSEQIRGQPGDDVRRVKILGYTHL